MNRSWDLTDLEFAVLWERINRSDLPRPFSFISRTRKLSDYEREKLEVWDRMRPEVDDCLRDVFVAMHRPEAYVVVLGWCDHDTQNPAKRVRARAVRSATHGYLLRQLPGETVWHSGGFTIEECGPHGIAEAVVRILPERQAGRLGSIPILTDQVDDHERFRSVPDSRVTMPNQDSPADRSAKFFALPAELTGAITVHQGYSAFGPRGILEQAMLWRDLPDDGRYVIVLDRAPTAMGIGTRRLVALIDAAVERMRDRADSHWEAG
ncbi:ESX secretion-associated protein EspG [Nocardia harenae]|uniref:ESX secretion-associated protein EspG n=1 Tax=Nocardia harenae TaxID=358707 RepID=UPI00083116AA|nr:ESX secretion-associated protein EspG [Nocardia harenae]